MSNENQIIPIDEKTGLPANVPEFVAADAGDGLQDLTQYLRPPSLKIKQTMSGKNPLYEPYKDGTLLLTPDATVVAEPGELIYFVPVYHVVEYIKTNPIGETPFVIERSTDGESDLAKKCKNPDMWITSENGKEVRHSEVHNFVVFPFGPTARVNDGEAFLMRFMRGTYKDGVRLLQLLNKRKRHMPIYACVFAGKTADRVGQGNDYKGMDISNPPLDSNVSSVVTDPAMYETLKAFYHEAQKKELDVEYEVDDADVEVVDANSEF